MKNYLLAATLLTMLSACGGGSSGSNDPSNDAFSADGVIVGLVETFSDGIQLAETQVTLSQPDGGVVATTSTDELGAYQFANLPRNDNYLLTFERDTYLTEVYNEFTLAADESGDRLALPTVRLLSNDNAGIGSLSGIVTNAIDGLPITGLTLEFIRGINNPDGELAATTTTDASGAYSVANLSFGNYTCIIFGVGLQTTIVTVTVLGDVDLTNQNAAISPAVEAGQTRIVLTWGESPRDLDSHFSGPTIDGTEAFRVYFGNRTEEDVILDVDDTSSFGPETVTLEDSSRPGVFRYSVFNFSGGGDDVLSNSGANVQVIREEGIVAEFFVPRGEGNLWTVFDMENGDISAIGSITDRTSTDDHFAPESLLLNASSATISSRSISFK